MIRASVYDQALRYKRDYLGRAFDLDGLTYALHSQGGAKMTLPYGQLGEMEEGDVVVLWPDDLPPWPGVVSRIDEQLEKAIRVDLVPLSWVLSKRVAQPRQIEMTVAELVSDLAEFANGRVETPIRDWHTSAYVSGMRVDTRGLNVSGGATVASVLDWLARDHGLIWGVRWAEAEDRTKKHGLLYVYPEGALAAITTVSFQDLLNDTIEIVSDLRNTANRLVVTSKVGSAFAYPRIVVEDKSSIGQYGLLEATLESVGVKKEEEARAMLNTLSKPAVTIPLYVKREACAGMYPGETIRLVLDQGRVYDISVTGMDLSSDLGAVVIKGDAYEVETQTPDLGPRQFTPLDLSGCQLWLDACTLAGTLADGGAVATWADRSANSNDAAQAVAGQRPNFETNELNGRPVVRFTAANSDELSHGDAGTFDWDSDQAWTMISVVQPGGTGWEVWLAKALAVDPWTGFDMAYQAAGTRVWLELVSNYGSPDRCTVYATHDISTAHHIVTGTHDGTGTAAGCAIRIDRSAMALTTDSDTLAGSILNASAPYVGSQQSSNFIDGDVAEIILYNRVLSAAELAKVEGYLADKWGIK